MTAITFTNKEEAEPAPTMPGSPNFETTMTAGLNELFGQNVDKQMSDTLLVNPSTPPVTSAPENPPPTKYNLAIEISPDSDDAPLSRLAPPANVQAYELHNWKTVF